MKDQIEKIIAEYLEKETKQDCETLKFSDQIRTDKAGFCKAVAAEIAEKLLPIVGEKDLPYDELFDHMANEHGLNLTNTELGDIIHIARGGEQKTGWDDAPDWAKYRTIDRDRGVTFWSEKPEPKNGYWRTGEDGGKFEHYRYDADWGNSLERRPK